MSLKLYKMTVFTGVDAGSDYYVVAKSSTEAEELIRGYYSERGFLSIEWVNSEQIAVSGDYGKPHILMLAGSVKREVPNG